MFAMVLLVARHLKLADLVCVACTCSAWNRIISTVWRSRCMARWHHWASPPPAQGDDAAAWKAYKRRHKVDASILQLLETHAVWPTRKSATYDAILAHGADALDVLAAAAQASSCSGMFIGLPHQAHMALLMLQGQLAAQHMGVLQITEAFQPLSCGNKGVGGPGPAAAGSSRERPAASSTGQQEQAGFTVSTGSEPDYLLEMARHLAQSLHPMSDMSAVRDIVDKLADELRSRLQQAGAQPGSREALTLLNELLFGDLEPSASTPSSASASEVHAAPPGSAQDQQEPAVISEGASSSKHHAALGSGCWSSLWPHNADLYGPDLSIFTIPSDGCSGIGLKAWAHPEARSQPADSCLDSLLSQRRGLSITLAILHRAMGRRVVLDIQLTSVLGHVIKSSAEKQQRRARRLRASGVHLEVHGF